ncbi:hypothetical protein NLX83_22795 [Allokutzneria sp. A3M-2-11 16]|uniref:effector-associated constant component EACC1 n=1 Tax=Allokutzneria sp. A3M-2-11 16 TaxID=2962043 RepID=UPI0020B66FE0|nr:hypothetical protein [Allokutzneria sp. A3M-2-11 16]MCP3802098.1 hypothetical protein [Allokutzneria sp. A3M-2-11 16]
MDVRITVEGGDTAAELRSLLAWLRREDELGPPRLATAVPAKGEMGALADAILLMLASGGMTVLTSSVRTYLKQRRADVKITIHTPDGHKVVIDGKGVPADDAMRAARHAIEQADGGK